MGFINDGGVLLLYTGQEDTLDELAVTLLFLLMEEVTHLRSQHGELALTRGSRMTRRWTMVVTQSSWRTCGDQEF